MGFRCAPCAKVPNNGNNSTFPTFPALSNFDIFRIFSRREGEHTALGAGLLWPFVPTMTREDCEYLYQVIEDFIASGGEVTADGSLLS